jgi:hypothetical protein
LQCRVLLDSVSPIDERPLSLFQGSVSEWSDMRSYCIISFIYIYHYFLRKLLPRSQHI